MNKMTFYALVYFLILYMISGCALSQKKGMFREFQGIFTMVEPTDIALYRSLLPQEFSMPTQPMVAIFVVDYTEVAPWPLTPYKEAAIFLKSSYAKEEGWYVIDIPVTRWVSMKGGRYLGFPKYVADEILLQQRNAGWYGEVTHQKKKLLSLEFVPELSGDLAETAKKFAANPSVMTGGILTLVPPAEGPTVQKITVEHVVTQQWATPQPGMVKIFIDPAEPWAGLLPPNAISLGVFNHYKGGMNLVPRQLN